MVIRLRNGKLVKTYLKLIACVLVAVLYFTFLYRESLTAFEESKNNSKKDREAGFVGVAVGINKPEIKLTKRRHAKTKPQAITAAAAGSTSSSTLNPVYDYSEELHSATEKELKQRRAHLSETCKRYQLEKAYPPNEWEFFISPGHNLVWCSVFKAASSTWLYYFNLLGGHNSKFLQRAGSEPLKLARQRFPHPELNELLESLASSLSFVFVREPFERLVSAYRDKLEGARNKYYKTHGQLMISQCRKPGGVHPKAGPSFAEFVLYIIRQREQNFSLNEHWAPVYSFCTPCSVNFTIIGKVDTFQRDSEYIIRHAGLETLLLGKLPKHKQRQIANRARGVNTQTLIERYFSEIDRDTLDKLLNVYRLDFELFDYNYTKYYDIVQASTAPANVTIAANTILTTITSIKSTSTPKTNQNLNNNSTMIAALN